MRDLTRPEWRYNNIEEFIARLQERGGEVTPQDFCDDEEKIKAFMPIMTADLAVYFPFAE